MKKLIVLFFFACVSVLHLFAEDDVNQRLTPEQFRAKQEAFMTQHAGLSSEEATSFFPVYFELQDKKKDLNDQVWSLLRKGRDAKTTDEQYDEILRKIYDLRIASDKLERSYYQRFKGILSPRKIYLIQRAEMRFHRELLKGVQRGEWGGNKNK